MNFIVSAITDIGLTKSTNQDSFCVKTLKTKFGEMVFVALCDGMGGLEKGEVASATVVNAYKTWVEQRLPIICESGLTDEIIRNEWSQVAVEYNEKIKLYGKKCGVTLGTTATIMLLTSNRYYILNIGDTRAYELYSNVKVLTKDHSLVAREIELGNLTEEEAKNDPRRSVLLQCVGASDTVYPDLFFGETKCNAVYMFCTDGFRHEITEDEIYQYLNPNAMTDESVMEENMKALVEINKQRNESDNISVITVRTY